MSNIDDILKAIEDDEGPDFEDLQQRGKRLVAENPVTPEAEADADAGVGLENQTEDGDESIEEDEDLPEED